MRNEKRKERTKKTEKGQAVLLRTREKEEPNFKNFKFVDIWGYGGTPFMYLRVTI